MEEDKLPDILPPSPVLSSHASVSFSPVPRPQSTSSGSSTDLKRRSIHTNVTVVENATRFWLSAQVMVACIMLGLLAMTINSGRSSVYHFPATINSSCVDATYVIKQSIQHSMEVMLVDIQEITNEQYRNSVRVARKVVSESLEMTIEIFLIFIKQVNPILYCSIDSGLGLANVAKKSLSNIRIPSVSCPIAKRNNISSRADPCGLAVQGLNDIFSELTSVLDTWPYVPTTLYDALDQSLALTGFPQIIAELSRFPAPDTIVNYNATELVEKAMANAAAFDDIALTCTEVSAKFGKATQKTSNVMFYIEIAIWASIGLLLLVIFIVAIVRQFPTAFVEWATATFNNLTDRWNARLDSMEQGTIHTWQLYLIWTLKYINFQKAILTTTYGLIGILLVYNLTAITDTASGPIEVWVNESLGPSFDKIQSNLQTGINQVLDQLELELNNLIQVAVVDTVTPMNGTLNKITAEKDIILSYLQSTLDHIEGIPIIGPTIGDGVECMFPIKALGIVNTACDIMIRFVQDLMHLKVSIPTFALPSISSIATRSTHVAITSTVSSIQSELKSYQIVFILLSVSFGILVIQGLLFVGLRRLSQKIKKERRLSKIRRQSVISGSVNVM